MSLVPLAPTNPAATNPAATNPAATNPAATNPAATNPAATNPAATRMPPPAHRPGPAPRRYWPDLAGAMVGLGLGAVIALGVTSTSVGALKAPGGPATAAGQLAGLVGTYLLLVMLLLIARFPWVERVVGQDRLVGWHRWLGPWPIVLLSLHALLVTWGYADSYRKSVLGQYWTFLRTYPDVLAASVGLGLIVAVGLSSFRAVRRRVHYESWWVLHLYTYLALALSFSHQLANGQSFVGHPLARWLWGLLWLATAGVVLVFRFLVPLGRSLRHRLRVVEVRQETPGVLSVVCAGRHLERLAVSGGQFFQWRFLTRQLWWQAHPYSLSALPHPPYLRVTIKAGPDHERMLRSLAPGTRIAIEGPYGAFTRHARQSERVVLVAAGVGVTPLRALLQDLPAHTQAEIILRTSRPEDLLFVPELSALAAAHGGGLHQLVGSRQAVPLDRRALLRLVPDLAQRDVYVCGPEGFTQSLVGEVRAMGLPEDRIHYESFSF